MGFYPSKMIKIIIIIIMERMTEKKTHAYKKIPKLLLIARLETIRGPRHLSFSFHPC